MAGPSRPPKHGARRKPAGRAINPRTVTAEQEAALQALLPALRRGRSVMSVAKELHLSQGVVQRARDGVRGRAVRGRPPVLLPEEEAVLVKNILYYAERGAPMTEAMLQSAVAAYVNKDLPLERRDLVRQRFTNGQPGRKWTDLFIGRHPEVGRVHGRSLQAARAAASNPENLARMFALLKQVRQEKKVTPKNLFNADECGVNARDLMTSTRKKFLGAKGTASSNLVPTVGSDAQALTFMPIIAADRTKLPPTFVVYGTEGHIKRRRLVARQNLGRWTVPGQPAGSGQAAGRSRRGGPPGADPVPGGAAADAATDQGSAAAAASGEWQFLNDMAPPNSLMMYRTPAGMNRDLWTEWCLFAAEKLFKDLRPSENKLLILDGCKVHLSYEALEALSRVRVEVFLLPANTTHITQQLDVVMFQPFKRELRDELWTLGRNQGVANNK